MSWSMRNQLFWTLKNIEKVIKNAIKIDKNGQKHSKND